MLYWEVRYIWWSHINAHKLTTNPLNLHHATNTKFNKKKRFIKIKNDSKIKFNVQQKTSRYAINSFTLLQLRSLTYSYWVLSMIIYSMKLQGVGPRTYKKTRKGGSDALPLETARPTSRS